MLDIVLPSLLASTVDPPFKDHPIVALAKKPKMNQQKLMKVMSFTALLANNGPVALRPGKIDTKLTENEQNSLKTADGKIIATLC